MITLTEIEITEAEYDEMLDECYPHVNVCGYDWYPSIALQRIDPIAYDCGFSDYASNHQQVECTCSVCGNVEIVDANDAESFTCCDDETEET
jgi:hypothetical protein